MFEKNRARLPINVIMAYRAKKAMEIILLIMVHTNFLSWSRVVKALKHLFSPNAGVLYQRYTIFALPTSSTTAFLFKEQEVCFFFNIYINFI